MRLLRSDAAGRFSLIEVYGKDTPAYAILSHTWSLANNEEYTFMDIESGTGKNKPGYRKVRFCLEQAQRDGLAYVWVDTCCIKKESSSELSEAINSMFRWYQNAARCYVYLSDVSKSSSGSLEDTQSCLGTDVHTSFPWIQALRDSKWFTRSWTLQELIAPDFVEFFSVEGESLGRKQELVREISDITGIPIEALEIQPCSVTDFSVEERINWARDRKAKREEDKAYSLLGIFDVCMPLIYGEGYDRAYKRLLREIAQWHGHDNLDGTQNPFRDGNKRNKQIQSGRIPRSGHNSAGRRTRDIFNDTHQTARVSNDRWSRPMLAASWDDSCTPPPENLAYGARYTTYGGIQYNHAGRGSQFCGDFYGPVNFG